MRGCRPLTDTEVEAVTEKLRGGRNGTRNATLFTVGLMTGFRVSELLSIQVEDVWQCGRVVDALTVRRRSMKGKSSGRTVHLNGKAKAALSEWVAARGTNPGPLFCSTAGKAISRVQVWRILDRVFTVIGMTGTLGTHCMRKTFADRMDELLDHDLKQLQGALGHEWITSTAQYISFKQDKINGALDRL